MSAVPDAANRLRREITTDEASSAHIMVFGSLIARCSTLTVLARRGYPSTLTTYSDRSSRRPADIRPHRVSLHANANVGRAHDRCSDIDFRWRGVPFGDANFMSSFFYPARRAGAGAFISPRCCAAPTKRVCGHPYIQRRRSTSTSSPPLPNRRAKSKASWHMSFHVPESRRGLGARMDRLSCRIGISDIRRRRSRRIRSISAMDQSRAGARLVEEPHRSDRADRWLEPHRRAR